MAESQSAKQRYQVAVIGAGMGGIALAWYLKQAGIENFAVLEKADGVGGTWRENTYPGAGCDVASHMYCFSFEPHYPWAYRYGKQAEILAYAQHCVDKYGLAPHLRFNAEVSAARFDEVHSVWRLRLADGGECEAEVLVSAVGQLSRPQVPSIPGQDAFRGVAFHSAHWNHDFDLAGKRVAVIGTGASAIQFVPEVARQAKRLYVFQRSAGWTIPKFERRRSRLGAWLYAHVPGLQRLDRLRIYLAMESVAYAYNGHHWMEQVVRFVSRMQLRLQVRDPALRARLTPTFPVGCKRILLTNDWYRTLVAPHVEVVSESVEALTATGVRTLDGKLREVDAVIYGTGFAATEFLTPMRVTGRGRLDLHETWSAGANAYLGMTIAGFPNFFVMYGPHTNLGAGSIIFMLECQSRYIVELVKLRSRARWREMEVTQAAHQAYAREMDARSAKTTYAGACHSWYKNAAGRNTNNWIGSCTEYRRRTRKPDLAHYAVAVQDRRKGEAGMA